MVRSPDSRVNWAMAEALAFGTLMLHRGLLPPGYPTAASLSDPPLLRGDAGACKPKRSSALVCIAHPHALLYAREQEHSAVNFPVSVVNRVLSHSSLHVHSTTHILSCKRSQIHAPAGMSCLLEGLSSWGAIVSRRSLPGYPFLQIKQIRARYTFLVGPAALRIWQ